MAANSDELFRETYLLTGDAAEATVLVRDVLGRLALEWSQVTGRESPLRFCRTELVCAVVSRSRRWGQRHWVPVVTTPERDPHDQQFHSETAQRDAVWTSLAELSAQQRAALVLVEDRHLAMDEVAELIGASERTVKDQLAHARVVLAESLSGVPQPGDREGTTRANEEQTLWETLAEQRDSIEPPWIVPEEVAATAASARRSRRGRAWFATVAVIAALSVLVVTTRGGSTTSLPAPTSTRPATTVSDDPTGAQKAALYQWAASLPKGARPTSLDAFGEQRLVDDQIVMKLGDHKVSLPRGYTGRLRIIDGMSFVREPLARRVGIFPDGAFVWSMSPDCRRVLVKELGVASRWSMYDLETQTVVPELMPPEMAAADFLGWESTTSLEGYAESVGGAAMTGFRWNLTTHAGAQFDVSFAQPEDTIETTE